MRKTLANKATLSISKGQELFDRCANGLVSTLIILSCGFLLYQYREGGIKDVGLTDTSIRDVGGYITTGIKIMNRVNPYIPDGEFWGGARWGTFGTVPVAMISELVPRNLQVVFFQVIGLLGLYLFINTVFSKVPKVYVNSVFLLLIWSSSFREMLTTNQIIGIVLGFVALGIRFIFSEDSRDISPLNQALGALCFVVALDLKPHISGLLIVGLYIYFRKGKDFIWLVSAYLVTHAAVDLYLGKIVELDWIKIVNGLSDRANKNELGDSVTIWPVIRRLVDFQESFGIISKLTLFLLIALTFWAAYKKYWQTFLFLSFFVPAFSIYFHYYDGVPLFSLVFWAILSKEKTIFSFVVLDMLIISKETSNLRNMLLVISISLMVAVLSTASNQKRLKNLVSAGFGFAAWQFIATLNSKSNSDQYQLQSLVVTQVLILASVFFVLSTRTLPKLEVFVKNKN